MLYTIIVSLGFSIVGVHATPIVDVHADPIEETVPFINQNFDESQTIPGWKTMSVTHKEGSIAAIVRGKQTFESNQVKADSSLKKLTFDSILNSGSYEVEITSFDSENVKLQDYESVVSGVSSSWETNEIKLDLSEKTDYIVFYITSNADETLGYLDNLKLFDIEDELILIENGDFNESPELFGWDQANQLVTIEDGRLNLQDFDSEKAVNVKSDPIEITAGYNYKIAADLDIITQSHSVEIAMQYVNSEGDEIPTGSDGYHNMLVKDQAGKGSNTYELKSVAPENAVGLKVVFSSGGISLTDVYVDKVEVFVEKEVEEGIDTVFNKLQNPGFELEELDHWYPESDKSDFKVSQEIAKSGTSSLHFHDSSDKTGTRIFSNKVKVEPNSTYIADTFAYVIQQTHSIVLELNFYDANNKIISTSQELFSSNSLGEKTWSPLKLIATSPGNANHARISFYSGDPSFTEAYFDDVSINKLEQDDPYDRDYMDSANLGQMVDVGLGQASVIQTNANGENEVYYHSNGNPGTFSVLNADTGELKFSEVIPATEALWAMTVGVDQNVYFGGTNDGKLFRYNPVEKTIDDLGTNPSDNWIWDLETSSDGKIYGSTYPSAGLFEYDIDKEEFKDLGSVNTEEDYARGLAVDDTHIYVGVGTKRHLYKVNRETLEKEEIILDGLTGETGTFEDIDIIGDYLFVSNGTINMMVLDKETHEVISKFQYSNKISHPTKEDPNKVYYKFENDFFEYDLITHKETEIELDVLLPDTVRVKDMQWINSGGPTRLALITQYGEYVLIDPYNKTTDFIELDISEQAVNIQSLEGGPDGKLYMGGYQRGMSIYNPFTHEKEVNVSGFAQPEGIGFLNDKAYFGTYVGAVMYSFDSSKPVDLNNNPNLEYKITEKQDRPFAITSGDNKLFVGTIPDYGVLGGSLAIYDANTDAWTQFDNIVENQSIISLEYHDGLLYGGTSVWGGLGIDPEASEAKIFVWDVETREKIKEFTPEIPDIDETPKMIGELSMGPDGNLWGVVDGTLFALDIETHEVVKETMIAPSVYNSSKWLPHRLQWGPDGTLYTTASRKLIAVDIETMKHKTIVDKFINNMTVGVNGSIFYALESELYEIEVPETDATLKEILVDGEVIKNFNPGQTRYEFPYSELKNVEYSLSQQEASAVVEALDDNTILIHVTATDGVSKLTYTINFLDEDIEDPDKEDQDKDDNDDKDEEDKTPGEDNGEPKEEDVDIPTDGTKPDKNENENGSTTPDGTDKDDDLPSTGMSTFGTLTISGISVASLGAVALFLRKRNKTK